MKNGRNGRDDASKKEKFFNDGSPYRRDGERKVSLRLAIRNSGCEKSDFFGVF
jgi:hypothetical protein